MAELPSGTVTFLFTDIEGSTRLLKRLGDRYSEVLGEQRRILREVVEARGGREVDTQGDSFFFAFARANAALAAAVDAQRLLAQHPWPEGVDVRVRMGLHTGEPAVGDDRYVGLGVHRAARVGAVAHGGQVLLSSATRELVDDDVGGVAVRELGTFQLKDIDRPERLFQLDVDGLPTAFPPLTAEKVADPHPLRRRAILVAALAGVVGAAVAIPVFALGQGGGSASIRAAIGDSIAFVDPSTNRLVADVVVGAGPTSLTAGAGAIWVVDTTDGTVDRIDPATRTVRQTVRVGDGPSGITFGDGSIWVSNGLSGTVSRIDAVTSDVVGAPIPVGNDPAGIAYAGGAVWVANTGDDTITRIDAATDKPKTLPIAATELVFGKGTLWASVRATNQVVRIDPSTGEIAASIAVGNGPSGIAFGRGSVWVVNSLDGTLSKINPETNSVATTIPALGHGPTGVAVDATGVWVSDRFDGTVARIDPRTNQVVRHVKIGNEPHGLATSGGELIVTVGQSGVRHRGGTLIVASGLGDLGTLDTAVSYGTTILQLLRMTGDGLVAFNQAGGLAGTELVPDLAVTLPTPNDGGATYTFLLRRGVRYSNGKRVEPSDVRETFERDFKIAKLPIDYYDGIVGSSACLERPRHCDLSRGIVTNDVARTVTFHLVAPDPEFLYKLALSFAYLVPTGSPSHELSTRPPPETGPYTVASYRPGHLLTLVRNRYFHTWSQAAQPDGYADKIVIKIGQTSDEAATDVINGRADAFSSTGGVPSPKVLTELETRFTSRVHSNPFLQTLSLFLNTRIAPFNNLDARRAVNYATNRAAAVVASGGQEVSQPTCQLLPPSLPGYRRYCPYAFNLAKARTLVAASGTRGAKVTVWGMTQQRAYTDEAVKTLRLLGYQATLKLVAAPKYFTVAFDPRNDVQVGFLPWSADYPLASGFFEPLLTCGSLRLGNTNSTNPSEFCEPSIDREIKAALAKQLSDPQAARRIWERIDRQAVDQAPNVPLANPKIIDVLSKRVGNYQYNPMWSMLFDQLWVR
jgi:peptide/nickel transport system substrate-binding protein